MNQKSLIVLLIIFSLIGVATVAYIFGVKSSGPDKSPTPTAMFTTPPSAEPTLNPTTTPSATDAAKKGTVTGKICFPSEGIPPGTLTAKNTTTKQSVTQAYPGNLSNYSFDLNPGTYHIKFEVDSNLVGFYTACAKNPTNDVCKEDSNHTHLDVVVNSNQITNGVDLCDFYWTKSQKTTLDQTF